MITNIKKSEVEILKETYLFANTPFFLFKQYSSLNFIKEKISSLKNSEIVKNLNELLNTDVKSLENVVMIYALIVSLTFKEYNETKNLLYELQNLKFEWVSKISSFIINQHIPESTTKINLKFKSIPNNYNITTNSNTQFTKETSLPKFKVEESI